MRPRKIFRTGLLLVLMAGLLAVSELKGAPRIAAQGPTALYLLAEWTLVLGDTSSGLELLDRALDGRDSPAPRADTLSACKLRVRIPTP